MSRIASVPYSETFAVVDGSTDNRKKMAYVYRPITDSRLAVPGSGLAERRRSSPVAIPLKSSLIPEPMNLPCTVLYLRRRRLDLASHSNNFVAKCANLVKTT